VIEDALRLYQTAFRKPSFTVYLLDVSGSMEGAGLEHLKTAMTSLLNQDVAGRYFLEASPEDVTVIIPFEANPLKPMAVVGNDRDRLGRAINAVHSLEAGGGTNIYRAVVSALGVMNGAREQVSGHLPAIVLMTDGRSNKGSLAEVENYWDNLNPDFDFPPIFGVTFGDADVSQLDELTRFAVGRVFDGRKDLEKAFRKAKGYN
jgi:Ca-activated chloride channel family protein